MKVVKYLFVFVLFICGFFQNVDTLTRIDPLVYTDVGLIRGLSAPDGDYSMFMGIPYATLDATNPFGLSQPHPGFNGIFEAYDDSAVCPQREEMNNTIVGNIDCLHLNVYVPNTASSENKLPVLVWIYGGGFTIGFGGRFLYGPNYLVRHDIILVTINYRLGPYGFMCLNIPEIPGNQGLKDQKIALEWVNHNIAAFGGDVSNINVFGESAGGASVDFHMHYNPQRLFEKAIIQSGTILSPWAFTPPDVEIPLKLSNYLGYETTDTTEALRFLASTDPHLVIAASLELDMTFRACVEQEFEGVEGYITEDPRHVTLPQSYSILIGTNDDERANLVDSYTIAEFDNYVNTYFNLDEEEASEMISYIRHFYMGDEELNDSSKWALVDFSSDTYFTYPTARSIQKYLDNGITDIYQYLFSYVGGRNMVKQRESFSEGGAVHADEIGYLFDISYMSNTPSLDDQIIIDRITTLWTNFVKYGNPTPETSELLPVIWPRMDHNTWRFLNINSTMNVGTRPFYNRMAFWDLFYRINARAEI